MGIVAGLGALGMGAYGLINGSPASNVQYPGAFSFPGGGQASSGALGGIGALSGSNLYGPNQGLASNITSGLVNNPYASQLQSGAGVAGGLGQSAGLNMFGAGQGLYGAGASELNNVFQNQPQLYNYLQNQNSQQANAQNAMSGVANTPYGAGVADQSNQLFNMNWQNFIQGQQLAALQGAGEAFNNAAGLQGQAPGTYLQGAGQPYSTYNAIGGNQMGALSGLGQFGAAGANQQNQQIQDYLGYLQAGSGAQNAATNQFNAQLGQANQSYLQNLGYAGMIGGGLGYLGNNTGLGIGSLFQQQPIYTTGQNFGVPANSPYANYPEV